MGTLLLSTGDIVGIGDASGTLRREATAPIASAWLTTVPLAAAFGAAMMWGLP